MASESENIGQQAQSDAIGGGPCRRDPYWLELQPDQRIERMRGEVKGLQLIVAGLVRDMHAMQQHRHGADDRLLVPYDSRSSDEGLGRRRNDEWF